ncbi:MAG: hypothetical protein M0R73_11675 [Dehalococcoidia bacterium]|nr:hypothetical protein [Dehalococcoidia bacterium]
MSVESVGASRVAEAPSGPVAYGAEIRWIMQVAMVLFVYTVVVGILNGLDLVTFDRKPLLAHLHIGTLAWITGAVIAGSLWLFGSRDPGNRMVSGLAVAAPVVAAAYNVIFLTTTNITRPIVGTLMMAVILVFAVWGFRQARGLGWSHLSVPHLGLLAGLATSVIGAAFGILLGLMFSNPDLGIAEGVGDAHPAAMVVGFLIPVGMAFAEWVLRPGSVQERATRAGQLQIGLPFLGGVAVVLGLVLDVLPLVMLSLPLELAGLGIFLWRMFPAARHTSWLAPSKARHGVAATLFLIVNICIFVYLVANYAEDGIDTAPRRLLLALDHSIFIGVLTMTIIPFIARLSTTSRPPWVDHVVFWGLTAGLAAFVAGLLSDTDALIRLGTPVLGTAILVAIVVHLRGLGDPRGAIRGEPERVGVV